MKKLFLLFAVVILTMNLTAQSISGNWVQPSIYGVDDGEFHLTVYGCPGDIIYFYESIQTGTVSDTIGHFYNIPPGNYGWGFIDVANSVTHSYPTVTLQYPPSLTLSTAIVPKMPDVELIQFISSSRINNNFGYSFNKH